MDRPHYYATARNSENVCPLLRVKFLGQAGLNGECPLQIRI